MPIHHQGIKRIKAELKPPRDATPAGVTPNGKQLYRRSRPRAIIVDRKDPVTGEQQYRKNTLTGEEIFKLRKVEEVIEVEQLFYLENEGNANVRMIPYKPPSDEERAANERRQQIADFQAEFQEALAEEALSEGLSPTELIARMRPTGGPGGEKKKPEAAQERTLPEGYDMEHGGGGWYTLFAPDGTEVPGPTGERWQGRDAALAGALAHSERVEQPLPEPDAEEAEEEAEAEAEAESEEDEDAESEEERALREAEEKARQEAKAESEMTPDI